MTCIRRLANVSLRTGVECRLKYVRRSTRIPACWSTCVSWQAFPCGRAGQGLEEYHTHPKSTDTFKTYGFSLLPLLQDRNTRLALNPRTFGVLAYYLMASALYQQQLTEGLCLTQETFERAKSILNHSSLRTGHGTGFSGNTASLPAVAAYLASEQCV